MLLKQCHDTRATVDRLLVIRSLSAKRTVLQERQQEWQRRQDAWVRAVQEAAWIGVDPGAETTVAGLRASLREHARAAAQRLGTLADIDELTRDPLWLKALEASEGATAGLRVATEEAWRAAVAAAKRPDRPAALKAQSGPIWDVPENQVILQRYSDQYAVFERLAKQAVPQKPSDLADLRAAAAACAAETEALCTNVPAAVALFFQAVKQQRATLADINAEVLAWLAAQGALAQFGVRNTVS